eukprot:UN30615
MTGGCGDTFANQIWCLQHTLGDDVDAIHYSWTYFESPKIRPGAFHEMFFRWGMFLPNRPVGLVLNTGGRDKFYINDKAISKSYEKYGVNYMAMSGGINQLGFESEWGKIGDGLHNTTREGESENINEERKNFFGCSIS